MSGGSAPSEGRARGSVAKDMSGGSAPSEGRGVHRNSFKQRSSTHATYRMRCTQRQGQGIDAYCPVRLVVFDFDECLTLLTYDVRESDPPALQERYLRLNFESPWVAGSRLEHLRRMLRDLSSSTDGKPRCLAILTRNNMGVGAVLSIIRLAGLDEYFQAAWSIPWRPGRRHGAFRDSSGAWQMFDPPIKDVLDHKADVLQHLSCHLVQWFPQLQGRRRHNRLTQLFGRGTRGSLRMEEIVLVDDQRANFQSSSGAQVLRYGKVARYDKPYRNVGFCKNMGGIGAHSDQDYRTLKRFVEEPWLYSETLHADCYQQGNDISEQVPIQLVVFDFDETLTIASFMPQEKSFSASLGWRPSGSSEWTRESLVEYNFESPWVAGSRTVKLRRLLEDLAQGRLVAILTRNPAGVFAVLNLLSIAGLEKNVAAVWGMPIPQNGEKTTGAPCGTFGVFQHPDGFWQAFDPPFGGVPDHKAAVLRRVASNQAAWLPQLRMGNSPVLPLRPEAIVLVDDERGNFRFYQDDGMIKEVPRCCKVARYDDIYRDCGPLNQLGGLGAHSDADYDIVRQFVEAPWEFPSLSDTAISMARVPSEAADNHIVAVDSEELPLAARARPKSMLQRRFTRRPSHLYMQSRGTPCCQAAGAACLRFLA